MYITNLKELENEFRIEVVVAHYEDWEGNERKKMCCPFHVEKTASFSVSKSRNIATCFGGCGSYSPIHFVRTKEDCAFVEAIEKCAALHGLPVKYDERRSAEELAKEKNKLERKEQMYHLNQLVLEAYLKAAYPKPIDENGLVEFQDESNIRTLNAKTLNVFSVCQTPDSWDLIQKQGFDKELLSQLGIIKERKDLNGHYDSFRNRQLFPIQVQFGRNRKIAGFGARKVVKDKKTPKYLNSTESIVYNKSALLYGFYVTGDIYDFNTDKGVIASYAPIEDDKNTNSSNGTWANQVDFNFDIRRPGLYVVEVTTGFNSNSKQSDIELRTILNDDFFNPLGFAEGYSLKKEPKDDAGDWGGTGSDQREVVAFKHAFLVEDYFSAQNIKFQFRPQNDGVEVSVWNSFVEIKKVG